MLRRQILILLLAFILTSIWFGPKKMLAHAEEGLPFFNPLRVYQNSLYLWQDTGLGYPNPFLIPRTTLNIFSAGLNVLRIPGWQAQQILFFMLIVMPLISIPPLIKLLLPDTHKSIGMSTAIFYVFNLFFISQVLQRFIIELFFLWSYLPLFLYLWINWLKFKKVKHLALLIISSTIFSNIFTITASVFTLWVPAGIMWLKYRKIIPAAVGMITWFLSAIWWWYPIHSLKESPFTSYLNSSSNLTSLVDVSKYYPYTELILLKQKYYFRPETSWFTFFSSRPIGLISKSLVGLLVIGIIAGYKQKNGKLIILWIFVGWFLVKGANTPWGIEFYTWLFNTFPFTQVLRNPYEKLGVVFLLPYCLLMAVGLSKISFRIVRTVIIFMVCFILLKPLWTGQVFAGYQVEVPPSYKQADSYLNTYSNLRLLHLPFIHGSGVEYNWGYKGDEPSEYLLSRLSMSKTYFFPGDPYMLIYQYLRSPKFYRLMQFFAIDTLVVHKDYLSGPTLQENYEGTKSMTSQMEHVILTKSFDSLDLYRLENVSTDWGYLTNTIQNKDNLADGLEMVVSDISFNPLEDAFTIDNTIDLGPGIRPIYTIHKISPVEYRYEVTQAEDPYVLVLSVNFHPNWSASIDGEVQSSHFQINGFANGWLIDKKGEYTVDVKFKVWPWESN